MFHYKHCKEQYKTLSHCLYGIVAKKLSLIPITVRFLFIAGIFSLICTTLIITPYVIRDTLTDNLRALGNRDLTIRDIDFNPLTGYFAIHGITAKNKNKTTLKVNSIITYLDWLKVINNNIIVESIQVKGVSLSIQYEKGQWIIGGFPAKQPSAKQETTNKIHYFIKNAGLRNVNLRFSSGKSRRQLFVRQIDLSGLDSRTIKRNGQLRISGTTHGARYDINALLKLFSKRPRLELKVKVKHFPANELQVFVRQQKFKMKGTIDYAGTWIVNINTNNTIGIKHKGNTELHIKRFSTPKMHINSRHIKVALRSNTLHDITRGNSQTRIYFNGRAPLIDFQPRNDTYTMKLDKIRSRGWVQINRTPKTIHITAKARASAKKFNGKDKKAKIDLVNANRIRVAGIQYSSKKGLYINRIQTGKLAFAQTSKRTAGIVGEFNQRLMYASKLVMHGFKINNKRKPGVSINGIYPTNIRLLLYRDTKRWPLLKLAREAIKKVKLDLPPVDIKNIGLRGYNKIVLYDRSFRPAFKSNIRITKLQVRNIDTRKTKVRAGYDLAGRVDRYTRFRFRGYTRPFTKNVNLFLRGTVRELILPKYSRYMQRFYGYKLNTGHLDADFNLNIKNSRLSGQNKIVLRRLGLKQVKRTSNKVPKMNLPVGAVVKLLTNSRNEIKILIPNTGNLNDPNFKFGINYQKAFETAFRRGVFVALKYTQPVGQAFTLFSSANKLLTSMRMKPVRFRGGSTYINLRGRWALKNAAKLMFKKRKITVKICSFYNDEDIEYFQMESGKKRRSRRWAIWKAKKLSIKRSIVVKRYLIRKQKVRSGRLFLCKPKYDKREKKHPRVKLSL